MTAVVEACGLGKVHGRGEAAVTALREVDLTVGAGEFVAVTGPSGCGKSTLLNLVGGLDSPTAGEIRLRGERIDQSRRGAPRPAAAGRDRIRLPVLQSHPQLDG